MGFWIVTVGLMAMGASDDRSMSLQEAVQTAFARRPAVAAAHNRLLAAKENAFSLSAYPATRLEYGYGTNPELGMGNDLFLAQPVDLFGKTIPERHSGEASVLSATATLKQEELDVQSEVIDSFAELQSAQAMADNAAVLAQLSQTTYDATKKRIDAGDLPPAQLIKADLDRQRDQAELVLQQQTYRADKERFAAALGIAASEVGRVSEGTSLSDIPAAERPDVLLSRSAIASAKADAAIAERSRFPDLELQFAHDYWDSSGHYTARVQFTWSIFDWGAASAKARSSRLSALASQHDYEDLLRRSKLEASAAAKDLEAAKSSAQIMAHLVADAQSLLEKEQKAYAVGASTLLDVLDATRTLREIQQTSIDAKQKLIQAEGKYLAATGAVLYAN
jgi:cobalt-zinc-cadmium efflux system outer membrane protein